jgi:hypothetical protein
MWETITVVLHLPSCALRHDVPMRSGHLTTGRTALPLHRSRAYSRRVVQGKEMLAPPVGLSPLLRWAQGPLSTPCRPGTPTCKLQDKPRSRVCDHALPHVQWYRTLSSLLGRAPVPPLVPQLRIPPPRSGGLWCHHMSHGPEPRLPAWEGSAAAACLIAVCRWRIKKDLAAMAK